MQCGTDHAGRRGCVNGVSGGSSRRSRARYSHGYCTGSLADSRPYHGKSAVKVCTEILTKGESDPSNEDRASESCGSAAALTLPVLNAAALTESGEDPVVTKYYFHGGKRVAMDREGVVQYLVGDGSSPGRTAWQFGVAKLLGSLAKSDYT